MNTVKQASIKQTFTKEVCVYYEDTDAGGIVYHANYLKFMERCRCDWLASLGFHVAEMQENQGIMFVVREANLKYELPAKLFDRLNVTCQALHVGKVRLVVQQEIYNQETLLCSARIKLATLESTSFKLAAMPIALHQKLSLDISDSVC